MSGAIPPLSQYAFVAWCSVKKAQGQLHLYLYLKTDLGCFFYIPSNFTESNHALVIAAVNRLSLINLRSTHPSIHASRVTLIIFTDNTAQLNKAVLLHNLSH
jgi:hypothetical protein